MSESERLHGEAAIIAEFFAPLSANDPGAAGLTDDCAVLTPAPGTEYVLTTDGLIEGVHFFPGDIPAFKALAVNVSDLIAKGATPERYLLNIALPEPPTRAFMTQLCAGLAEAQAAFGCHLIGGDTDRTPGPFTLTITAIGAVPAGRAVPRSGARKGDIIAVTGSIGDAGLGLALRQKPAQRDTYGLPDRHAEFLIARYERPRPQLATAALVREFAHAAADISDGLAKDLGRLTAASGLGAAVELGNVPLSEAAMVLCETGAASRRDLIASGEDYEVVFTLPPERWRQMEHAAKTRGIRVTAIGHVTETPGVIWRDEHGDEIVLPAEGWDHF